MIEELIPANAQLVVQLPNEQVYCVPKAILTNSMRSNGLENLHSARDSFNFATFRDLSEGELSLLPKACLNQFSVPDKQVGYLIRRFKVRGIQTPYKMQPYDTDPSKVPLYGNLTNPKWASIGLGGSCNSRCTFCYTDWLRTVPDFHTEQVKNLIDRIADIGTVETLVFSGGEATIRQDLIPLFAYANQVGFSDIGLQTNGRKLKDFKLVKKLVDLGLKRVLLSLHGSNEKIHDAITGAPGSFVEALEGLRNLRLFSIEPTVNIVMCQENYEHLTEIVVLLGEIFDGYGRLRFSYPIVEGAAFDNLKLVLVSFSKLKPLMLAAIQLAEEMGFEIEVTNMPLCIADENHRDTGYDTVALSEFVEASPFYKFNVPRGEKSVKLDSCTKCSKATLCRGIQVEYLRAYPDSIDEFMPIRGFHS